MAKNRTLRDHVAVAAAFTLAALAATPGSARSVRYEVTDLGAPIGGATNGAALNNVGQATGDSGNTGAPGGVGAQAFRFDPDEGMIILNDGPELRSLGTVINDVGQVAGVICVTDELPCDWRLFRHTDGIGIEILGVLGTGYTITPRDINGSGDVVGNSAFGPSSLFHAFLFTDQDGLIDLGTLGGGPISDGMAVNDAGQVVGRTSIGEGGGLHAFLWDDGVMQDLGTLGGSNSTALGINDAGQIVGGADLPDHTEHAFRYAPGVGMVDLHPPAADSSRGLFDFLTLLAAWRPNPGHPAVYENMGGKVLGAAHRRCDNAGRQGRVRGRSGARQRLADGRVADERYSDDESHALV